jgi:Cyclic nucleotide-binding domain
MSFLPSLLHTHISSVLYVGDIIIQKGTEGNVFYLIKEGTVRVTDVGDGKTYNDHDLGPGEYFGERSLITGGPRAANISAVSNVILMALDRVSFISLLGPLKDVLDQNMILRVINSLNWFQDLSNTTRVCVAKAFVLDKYDAGKQPLSLPTSLYLFVTLCLSAHLFSLCSLFSVLPFWSIVLEPFCFDSF